MATTHLSGPLVVAAGTTTGGNQAVTGNLAVTGTTALTGVATLTEAPVISALTASLPVFTSAGKALVSGTQTGTGTVVVVQNTPTLTTPVIGAATGTSLTVTGALASRSATATPAAASAVPMVVGGSALVGVYFGSGNPNTALTAPQGSLFLSTDGNTTATRLFINSNGTTGWVAITTAS